MAAFTPVRHRSDGWIAKLLAIVTPGILLPQRPAWLDPQQSIGQCHQPLGKGRLCWEAVGPARAQLVGVCRAISQTLSSFSDILDEGQETSWSIGVNLFMVGPEPDKAQPVVIICCSNSEVRKTAVELILRSEVLLDHEGVQLGSIAQSPRPLAAGAMTEIESVDSVQPNANDDVNAVYTRRLVMNPCGAPIFVRTRNSEPGIRKATMGGVIVIDEVYYGMTSCHEASSLDSSFNSDDAELVIEGESGSNTDSARQSPLSTPALSVETNMEALSNLSRLGTKLGSPWTNNELDWELFRIDDISYKVPNIPPSPYRGVSMKWTLLTEPEDRDVFAVTSTAGVIRGRLSGTPAFLRMPGHKRFQEMWTVYLEAKPTIGDCGSWVVDSITGDIYGHIIAGVRDIAYIVPAPQTSADIADKLGGAVSLPTEETPLFYDSDPEAPVLAPSGETPNAGAGDDIVIASDLRQTGSVQEHDLSSFELQFLDETPLNLQILPYSLGRAVPVRQDWCLSDLLTASRLRTWLSHLHILLGTLWIVPAILILVLHFRGTTVGANRYSTNPHPQSIKITKENYDALVTVQMASKALEIWYMFVAASLVYDVTMFLAERKGKFIPIGFLTAYLEFGNLTYFSSLSPWTTPLRTQGPFKKELAGTLELYGFLLFVICMSITTLLMGPGSAVLMTPTLQYRNATYRHGDVFGELMMANQPSDISTLHNCTFGEPPTGNYRCLANTNMSPLNTILIDVSARNSSIITEQDTLLLFSPSCLVDNSNYDCALFSFPNRRILRRLLLDLTEFKRDTISGADPSPKYSLRTTFHRMGPSISQNTTCSFGNTSIVVVAHDQMVRCYSIWKHNLCVPAGRGWNHGNKKSSFSIGTADEKVGNVLVDIYTSEAATNQSWGLASCDATDISCWNSQFAATHDPAIANVTITEYRYKNPLTVATLYCMTWTYPSCSQYELNPSLYGYGNDISSVRITSSSQNTTTPQKVHPDWLLAGWAVQRGGVVPASWPAAKVMTNAVSGVYERKKRNSLDYFTTLQELGFAQTMSLVNFTTFPRETSTKTDDNHPTLDSWAVTQIYAYGGKSITASMGVYILTLGIIATLCRTVTALRRRESRKSAFELLTVALRHQCNAEFDGNTETGEMRRVRVGVQRLRYRGEKKMLRFKTEG